MKRILLILSLFLFTGVRLLAQDDDQEGKETIRDKMNEYIQKRLNLSADEAKKFTPIFLRYFKEWRTTLRENRNDKLELQRKVVDLRIRYRGEFREVLGEKRGGQVFDHQEIFIREMREIGKRRLMENRKPIRTNKALLPN